MQKSEASNFKSDFRYSGRVPELSRLRRAVAAIALFLLGPKKTISS